MVARVDDRKYSVRDVIRYMLKNPDIMLTELVGVKVGFFRKILSKIVLMRHKEDKKMSVKVFIVQPIFGKTEEQIEEERVAEIKAVSTLFGYTDIEVVNDICFDCSLEVLGKAIIKMAEANVVYFGKGWKHDSECNILYNVAAQYDLYTIKSMLKD